MKRLQAGGEILRVVDDHDQRRREPGQLLVNGPPREAGEARRLWAQGLILGMLPTTRYVSEECTLVAPTRLFVFSDGVYEIQGPDDSMPPFEAFEEVLTRPAQDGRSELDELLRFAQDVRGTRLLEDDFSILKLTL